MPHKTTTTIDVGTLAHYKRMTGVVLALCTAVCGNDKLCVLLYRYRVRKGCHTWFRRAQFVDRSDLGPVWPEAISGSGLQHDHLVEALDRQAASSGLRDSRVSVLVANEPEQQDPFMSEKTLSPKLVEAYLRRAGWTEPQPRSATFATFCKGTAWIDVPVCAEHFAYPRRFRELMTKLSRLESRPVAVILDEIAAVPLPLRITDRASAQS